MDRDKPILWGEFDLMRKTQKNMVMWWYNLGRNRKKGGKFEHFMGEFEIFTGRNRYFGGEFELFMGPYIFPKFPEFSKPEIWTFYEEKTIFGGGEGGFDLFMVFHISKIFWVFYINLCLPFNHILSNISCLFN